MYLDLLMNTVLFADEQAVGKSDDLRLVLQILKFVRGTILKFLLLKKKVAFQRNAEVREQILIDKNVI